VTAVARFVVQFASFPAVAIVLHSDCELLGSESQQSPSSVQASPPVPPPPPPPPPEPPPPPPLLFVLELQAAAAMRPAKRTGMAKSVGRIFMGGHHTRRFDRVKND